MKPEDKLPQQSQTLRVKNQVNFDVVFFLLRLSNDYSSAGIRNRLRNSEFRLPFRNHLGKSLLDGIFKPLTNFLCLLHSFLWNPLLIMGVSSFYLNEQQRKVYLFISPQLICSPLTPCRQL